MLMTPARLTKRQKKGIAFRERKRSNCKDNQLDEIDVPSFEDQVFVDDPQGQQVRQVSAKVPVRKRKAGKGTEERLVVAGKKRKREVGEEEEGALGECNASKAKRRRASDVDSLLLDTEQSMEDHVGAGEIPGRENEKMKQRFILFLGNLKYTTTPEAIQAHFSVCAPPPTVRLLTPKPFANSAKPAVKSKGCAFLEFAHRGALQQGLKLHLSQLDGRQINVELTAGGGGRGATRMKKLKERNKQLEGQRRKRQGLVADTQPPAGTRRFSTTSGTEKTHSHKRTWTVGDVEEEETRRGKKHKRGSKKQGPLVKDFRTGVNAIPVG